MGDIADMILDGDLCEICGVYLDGSAGYPRRCKACSKDDKPKRPKKKSKKEAL